MDITESALRSMSRKELLRLFNEVRQRYDEVSERPLTDHLYDSEFIDLERRLFAVLREISSRNSAV